MSIFITRFAKIPTRRVLRTRFFCNQRSALEKSNTEKVLEIPGCFHFHANFDQELQRKIVESMLIYPDFITQLEEETIYAEIQPYLKRLRYEFDHWDDAIHGYRETEKLNWNESNSKIIERLRKIAFPPGTAQLAHVHVLDLDAKGVIKPHIDSVRFCGSTIAGISLLSSSVMRLVNDKRKDQVVDIFLKQRSLYIMKNDSRYDYTHEILGEQDSIFKGEKIPRTRRISVICRNEPSAEHES
ncbi:alpha-ketoglutarate-dependent dioxygenase alkB homolog 7, mitochondrial [Neocloeon triangulifer]|uniref:alpha-ketoglutarate-dependent dioxygenase alkB homolog 7, mitochondrial n=1 Tax=Neocloeon triangulifer TaxID=2078957 RepID=UPI00286EDF16|nr:alpha-ketoglutarate-dependent dioxygenase alkB homolog 7, mitochondrial [Neocloeon triangulifer]